MASVERPGLWSFATLGMPVEPTGSYQTVGLLLKIAGWVRLAVVALTLLVGGIVVLMLALTGVLGGIMAPFMGPLGPIAGALGGIAALVALMVLLVVVAVSLLMLYWNSWIYAKWAGRDPRALQHAFVYGIVTVVLSGLGALGAMGGNPSGLLDIGLVAIGILLIVESRKPEHADFGSGMPQRPEAWQPIDEQR